MDRLNIDSCHVKLKVSIKLMISSIPSLIWSCAPLKGAQLQIREGIEDNSKIAFLISQRGGRVVRRCCKL